jgi:hypothetical protein
LLETRGTNRPPGLSTNPGEVIPVLHELFHGSGCTRKRGSQRGELFGAMETDGEREEKEDKLTARTWAFSGKPEEDRRGRISPVTVQEEEGHVVGSERSASILRAETILAARQSRWRAWLGLMLTMLMGRRRGGDGGLQHRFCLGSL